MLCLYRPVLVALVSAALTNCAVQRSPAACGEGPRPACPVPEPVRAADPPESFGVTVGIAGMMPFRVRLDDRRMHAGVQAPEYTVTTPPGTMSRRSAEQPAATPMPPAVAPAQAVALPIAVAPPVASVPAPATPPRAAGVSDAPLLALAAYIELSGNCAPGLVKWHRESVKKAASGELPRSIYYRVLGYLRWGQCARPSFPYILEELQKASDIHAQGLAPDTEFEAKETELVNLFFAAAKDRKRGQQLVKEYEAAKTAHLTHLPASERQSDCVLFGDRPRCLAKQAPVTAPRRETVLPPQHPPDISDAPLQALNAYIELSGTCSRELLEWNKTYGKKTMAGATPRSFYYRVLGYVDWGPCGRPFFAAIFGELQKVSNILASGRVSQAEFEAKETELINLFFAALQDRQRGEQMVQAYEATTAARLIDLTQPRQYFNCTFFGDQPRCDN